MTSPLADWEVDLLDLEKLPRVEEILLTAAEDGFLVRISRRGDADRIGWLANAGDTEPMDIFKPGDILEITTRQLWNESYIGVRTGRDNGVKWHVRPFELSYRGKQYVDKYTIEGVPGGKA